MEVKASNRKVVVNWKMDPFDLRFDDYVCFYTGENPSERECEQVITLTANEESIE